MADAIATGTVTMTAGEWRPLLDRWTRGLLERKTSNPNTERSAHPVNGLGFPGATDQEIAAAEERLGVMLPPSYREFLKATNGLLQPYSYVAACGGDFCSAEEIDWFRVRNTDWIDAYEDVDVAVRGRSGRRLVDELRGTLEISRGGDAAVYLLNPDVVDAEGECEALFFASWSPDVERFRSFSAMMRARYRLFVDGVSDGF
jgi:hypothetical protein